MARQTRRKSRTKKTPPKKRVYDTTFYRKGLLLKGREEMKNWKVALLLTGIFFLALFIRVYFNVGEATDDGFKMTGGSDPYYHKRAVDWVIHKHEHLGFDPMLNYPIGIPNPRPPIFDWSLALTGIVISPFFGGDVDEATWWAVEFMPALWGALIILPVYFIGKESFNKRTGLMAAFLISIMAGHVGHATFALADHDSFFLFFAAVSIYYFQRAVNCLRDGEFVKDWTKLRNIRYGFAGMVKENKVALGYALFAGMTMSVIALAWKGFPYIMTIIVAYFIFQLFINKLRDVDSLNLSFISLVALSLPMALSAPYYCLMGFVSWWTTPLYMFIAVSIAAFVFVPTKRVPWLLVFLSIFTLTAISFILMKYVFRDFGSLMLGGAQYFVRTKLFKTIAEAQPPTFSRIVFSYGIVTFFLAFFIGIPYLAYRAFKSERKDMMFMLVWAVLGAYMASSAVRFIFNGTPIMAILSAWVIVELLEWVDFRKMVKDIRSHTSRGEGIADKFRAVYRGTQPRHVIGAILVLFLIVMPNTLDAIDAGIPYEKKKEMDDNIYNFLDDHYLGVFLPSNDTYDPSSGNTWYLGSFGPSFPNGYWLSYFDWLKQQDNRTPPNDRPAFISWWDYGFWAIQLGEHPTVADNFQTGYQFAGNFIAAQGEEEAIALMIQRLLDANIRKNNRHFGEKEERVLLKYLNDTSIDRLLYIYTHSLEFETHNVSAENGRIRAMRDVLVGNLTLDEMVDIYHNLHLSTGHSIRYFAIDARLFPFTGANNIFYAPITLADLDVGTYLETLYVPGDSEGNPTGERLTAEEVEKRAELDRDFRIVDTDLRHKREFFKTMLYKTYIGWYGEDINQTMESGIPGVKGNLRNQNIVPGWMMRHFKEVYRTFYWNPYPADEVDDHPRAWEPMSYKEAIEHGGIQGNISSGMHSGVTCLKYYHGAIVSGKVLTDKGSPAQGIRVTIYDDQMTPHDTVITDENGEYGLIAPFGRVVLIASKGPMSDAQHHLLQMGENLLNTTSFNVTDQQAMRLAEYNISRNLVIPSAAVKGRVYWDEDSNGDFDEGTDTIISDPHIVLREFCKDTYYNLTPGGSEEFGDFDPEKGTYEFNGIPPGEYRLSFKLGDHLRDIKLFTEDDALYPGKDSMDIEAREQDIAISPATITGTLNYANGTRAQRKVTLVDILDGTEKTTTAIDGKFLFTYILNGNYEIRVTGDDVFQEYTKPVDALEGEVRDSNITLYPAVTITGTTYYDAELRGNVTVFFNSTVPGLSTKAVSDDNGSFSVKLAATTYDITGAENVGDSYHAAYKRTSFSTPTDLTLNMKKTFELTGKVYYDRNGNNSYDKNAINREEVPHSYVILRGGGFVLTTESNGRGDYTFPVPEGRYSIEAVDNDTRRTVYEEFTLTGDRKVMLQLGSAHTVKGRVTHSGWKGKHATNLVPGVNLEFERGEESYLTLTNTDGNYELYVPEGNYTVTLTAFGFQTLREYIEVAGNVTKDFVLTPRDTLVEGTVRHDGQAISGVEVKFDDDNMITTDPTGHYSIVLPPGDYHVTFRKIMGEYRYFATKHLTLNIGSPDLIWSPDLEKQLRLSGTFLYYDEEKRGNILFESRDYAVSEEIENGSFETYVIPGDYRIEVDMEGNTYYRFMSVNEPLSLSMSSRDFARVRGYVYNDVDRNNKYTGSDQGIKSKVMFSTQAGHRNETTSSSGYFSLRLYKGTYTISITAAGYEDHEESHTYMEDEQYNFQLTPYPIVLKGTVWYDKNDDGKREQSETVTHVLVIVKVKSSTVRFTTLSDAGGNYSFTLAPGRYTVSARYSCAGKNFSYSTSVTLRENDEEMTQHLNLRLKYEVKGIVVDYLRGTPMESISVEFLDEHGNTIEDTTTDDDGRYSVVIPEGDYTLYSYAEEGNRTLVHIGRVSISEPQTLDINLLYGVKLQGQLYSGDIDHGVDIGRMDLVVGEEMSLNMFVGVHGEYSFYLPLGTYHVMGDHTDRDQTPDVKYILDTEVMAEGHHNFEDYNIEVEKQILHAFEWEVDSGSKVAYIGYYADGYRGAEFTFNITNTGNESEGIALTYTFDNRTYWEGINFDPDTIDIPAGETKEVTFRVRAQDDSPVGRVAEITINASVTDEEEISDEMSLTVRAKRTKVGDAVIEDMDVSPSGDIFENERFTLSAELSNPVEFSRGINVTVMFEYKTPSGQLEVVGKNVTTLNYGRTKTVSQTIKKGEGGHRYQVRIIPSEPADDSNKANNMDYITVTVKEKPEEELTGWKGTLSLGTNDARISGIMLIAIFVVIGVTIGYIASSKKRKRGRRYRRRHTK